MDESITEYLYAYIGVILAIIGAASLWFVAALFEAVIYAPIWRWLQKRKGLKDAG